MVCAYNMLLVLHETTYSFLHAKPDVSLAGHLLFNKDGEILIQLGIGILSPANSCIVILLPNRFFMNFFLSYKCMHVRSYNVVVVV